MPRPLFAAAVLKSAELREAWSWVRGIGGIDPALDVLGERRVLLCLVSGGGRSSSASWTSLPASPVTDEKFAWNFDSPSDLELRATHTL